MATLQAFHHRKKKTKLTLEMDHDLAEQVKAYGGFYKNVHGAEVTPNELVMEIARQFFAGDAEFQRFRSKQPARDGRPSQAAAAPVAAG